MQYDKVLKILRQLSNSQDVDIRTDKGRAFLSFDDSGFTLTYKRPGVLSSPENITRDDILPLIERHLYLEEQAKISDLGWLEATIKDIERQQQLWIDSECIGG